MIVFLCQKPFKSNLNTGLYGRVLSEFLFISSFQKDFIFIIILLYQCIDVSPGNLSNSLCDLIDRISINFPAELNLSFYLVALCDSYISHIVCYTHNTHMAALNHAHSGAHP